MLTLLASVVVPISFLAGLSQRGRPSRPQWPGYVASAVLMYVATRSILDAVVGVRPTTALTVGLSLVTSAYLLGRVRHEPRALAAVALAAAVFLLSFRHGWDSTLGVSAQALALPAFILGVLCARVDPTALRRGVLFIGVAFAVLLMREGSISEGRLLVLEENPIWVGRTIGFSLIAIAAGPWKRHWRWLLVAAGVAVMFMTGSRGPMWGVLVAVVYLERSRLTKRAKVLSVVAAIAGLAIASAVLGFENVRNFGIEREASDDSRKTLWTEALNLWLEQPGFGSGMAADQDMQGGYAHNSILELLVQGGVVSTAIFLIVVLGGMIRAHKHSELIAAFLIAAIIMSQVSGSVWVNLEVWLLAGWAFTVVGQGESFDHSSASPALGAKNRT